MVEGGGWRVEGGGGCKFETPTREIRERERESRRSNYGALVLGFFFLPPFFSFYFLGGRSNKLGHSYLIGSYHHFLTSSFPYL